jgi:hypothetical protein
MIHETHVFILRSRYVFLTNEHLVRGFRSVRIDNELAIVRALRHIIGIAVECTDPAMIVNFLRTCKYSCPIGMLRVG